MHTHTHMHIYAEVHNSVMWCLNVFSVCVHAFLHLSIHTKKCIACLIFIGHFPQKSPIISCSFVKNDLQLEASYGLRHPCMPSVIYPYIHTYIQKYKHTYMHTYNRTIVYIHTHTHAHIHMFIHTFVLHTHIHTYTNTRIRAQSYIHEFIHKCNRLTNTQT